MNKCIFNSYYRLVFRELIKLELYIHHSLTEWRSVAPPFRRDEMRNSQICEQRDILLYRKKVILLKQSFLLYSLPYYYVNFFKKSAFKPSHRANSESFKLFFQFYFFVVFYILMFELIFYFAYILYT